MDNSVDRRMRSTRNSRHNLQNIPANSRSRSRSPAVANSSNISSNGNELDDQMTPLQIINKEEDEFEKFLSNGKDMGLTVIAVCRSLKETVDNQQKSIEELQKSNEEQKKSIEEQKKSIEELKERVSALEKSQRCSKCQKLLDNKKSFCSACVCES